MLPQQPYQPRQGAGGRFLAAQQHGRDIAGNDGMIDAAAGFLGRQQHGLQHVDGLGAQCRIGRKRLACLGDKTVRRRLQCAYAAFQAAVRGKPQPAPVREGHQRAAGHPGHHDTHMVLQFVVAVLQRIDVLAKGETGNHIDRVAFEVTGQIHLLLRLCRRAPALRQPQAHLTQAHEIRLDHGWRKAVHDHAALRQPVAALGQQDAGSAAQFGRDIGRHGGAAEGVGPRTQYLADRRAVRQHHHLPAADAGPEYRAVAPAPLFHGLVDGAGVELVRIAEKRQRGRGRQIGDFA